MNLLFDYTFRQVALGCAIFGLASGVIGCFAILRRQGLLGDALAHASLPGICLAFLVAKSSSPAPLMAGAAATGSVAAGLIQGLVKRAKVDEGSALAVMLTSFFGLGIVLLSFIQKSGDATQAGLDKMIFGQAASITDEHVRVIAIVAAAVLLIVIALHKEMKLACFDPDFASVQGLRIGLLNALMTAILVASIVIGLNTVGVVLMSAMLVAPGAAARQWSRSLTGMLWGAGAIGTGAGVSGAWVSMVYPNTPTGPAVVLSLAAIALSSILFGRERGLIWVRMRQRKALA